MKTKKSENEVIYLDMNDLKPENLFFPMSLTKMIVLSLFWICISASLISKYPKEYMVYIVSLFIFAAFWASWFWNKSYYIQKAFKIDSINELSTILEGLPFMYDTENVKKLNEKLGFIIHKARSDFLNNYASSTNTKFHLK